MEALWIKNGTIFVHLQRYFIERRFINTSGQGIPSENSYQKFSCLHDKVAPKNGETFKARPEPGNEYYKFQVAVER